jgi:hypothetical protein
MANLGHKVSHQTVGNILKRHDIPPAPKRKQENKLERLHPRSRGGDGGNGFLHGGSAHAKGIENVLQIFAA